MLRIAVLGAAGRMGRAVIDIITRETDLELAAAWVRAGDRRSGEPVASWHPAAIDSAAITSAEIDKVLAAADVAIDFSLPGATETILQAAEKAGLPLVCGVTGLGPAHHELIAAAGQRIPLVYDRNMSVGIHILKFVVRETATRLGTDYDAEIIDAHHRGKRDAPSGTALMLGETLAAARNQDFAAEAVFSRHGESGPRPSGSIGFSAIRAGAIVGEHTVLFAGSHDCLSFSHQAQDRTAFASGAIVAARWLRDRRPGVYSMADVLAIA